MSKRESLHQASEDAAIARMSARSSAIPEATESIARSAAHLADALSRKPRKRDDNTTYVVRRLRLAVDELIAALEDLPG